MDSDILQHNLFQACGYVQKIRIACCRRRDLLKKRPPYILTQTNRRDSDVMTGSILRDRLTVALFRNTVRQQNDVPVRRVMGKYLVVSLPQRGRNLGAAIVRDTRNELFQCDALSSALRIGTVQSKVLLKVRMPT